MKKRMKMLMTLFLSASMALTPITVMADDGQAQTQNTYEASVQETEVNTSSFGAETNEPETGTYVQKEEASDNQTPSVGTEEETPASGGSSDSDEGQGTSGSGEPEEISTGVQSQNTENTDSNTDSNSEGIEHVKELIAALPDIKDVTAKNETQIKAAENAYNALSDADKATLDDQKNTPAGKEQSYGRVLESALWGLEVLKKVDNSTTLPQGTYSASTTPALTSSSSKGKSSSSRIRTWTVTEVTVDGQGKAVATIQVDSGTYTTLRTNGETYQGTVSGAGKHKVTTFQNVPIDLNSTFYIAAYSSTMETEIGYSVTTEIDESAATALTITNNTGMFKAETARLEKQGDQTFLVMDLSGSGYHELYKGTYEEAVSNGDGSKDKGNDSWVHGYTNSEGRWEFSIPLTGEELNGTDIPLVAVSNTYYSKYQKGENELKRAFYPRKIQVNESAKTLVTGDFTGETSLTVTLADGIMMKKPDAKLETYGGPNSNGYGETLKLIMQNGSYDRLYIGSKEDAAEAETKGETTRLDDANTFTVVVREGSFGGNITKDYLEQPVIVSFRGTSSGNWVERKVTISKTAKTLKIDPVTEQIKFRAVDEEGNTVEGASFTVKRKDTQINPDSDSAYTLVKDTAYTVEAGADGYETQTFTYTPDGTETEHTVTLKKDESAAAALTITNKTGMFKAVNARLEKQGDQTYLVMDLSGSGYHELYKGTYEEAVSNGDGSKDKGNDSWVHGYQNSEGRWEFSIPLTGEELNGTDIPLVAVSNTYYSKYQKGENELKRAFYPRKIQVDENAKTLVTGDFTSEASLAVTLADGIMMKKPDAKLETVGGPNSNGYSETLKLIMQNDSYDRLYIGSKEDAAKAEAKGETTYLDDANTFTVAVREGSFGGNIATDYLEKPVIVSFRGTSSGKWVERKVTISKTAKTLRIDPVTEQIKFRAVDEEGNTVEGASFTVKRKNTQINPDSDSTYTLVKDTAYTVEAGADGFEAQTFNYTPDGTETEHTVTLKKEKKEELKTVGLSYSAHVQNIGWQANVTEGTEAGTVGKSLQMEAIKLSTTGDADVQVEYRSHIQNSGWENGWTKEGQISGTTGKKLRMEAVQIRLTGSDADKYDIWYQAHVQNYGWLGWAKNGASAGTTGKGLRMEAIRVRILPKGSAAPGSTDGSYVEPLVCYQTHVQNKGWMTSASDGEIAGTTGKKLRMEAVKLTLNLPQSEGGIAYQSHLQNTGWEQSWKANGQISGTTGQKRRLEAVRIKLTGNIAEKYDIYYRVHVQNKGWTGWAKNGEDCGSTGLSLRGEALETVLVLKGAPAPGSTANTCWK